MAEDYQQLKERLVKLEDEQLIEMMLAPPGEYRQDALDIASAELKWRGVEIPKPEQAEEQAGLRVSANPLSAIRAGQVREAVAPNTCVFCGGRLRAGTLVAEKELTVVFSDNREERFVNVNACTQCGNI